MIQIGRFWVGALLVVLVGAVLGCSDDGDAVREAEQVAEAALLSVGDLPSGDWVVVDDWMAQPREPVPAKADWPAECGSAGRDVGNHEGLLAGGSRVFSPGGADEEDGSSGYAPALVLVVMVFDSSTLAAALREEMAEEEQQEESDECGAALDALGETRFVGRTEEPHYGLPDSDGERGTVLAIATPTDYLTSETHLFVRGRVIASYLIMEAGDLPPEFDPQALLEAFAARVVAAQE